MGLLLHESELPSRVSCVARLVSEDPVSWSPPSDSPRWLLGGDGSTVESFSTTVPLPSGSTLGSHRTSLSRTLWHRSLTGACLRESSVPPTLPSWPPPAVVREMWEHRERLDVPSTIRPLATSTFWTGTAPQLPWPQCCRLDPSGQISPVVTSSLSTVAAFDFTRSCWRYVTMFSLRKQLSRS